MFTAAALLALAPLATGFMPHARLMAPRQTVAFSEPDFGAAVAESPKEPKLFVANLDFGVTDEDLQDIFGPYGNVVEAHHVNDKFDPSRKKGFAFVTFEAMAEAEAAIDACSGMEVNGREISVSISDPSAARKGPKGPRRDTTDRRVYVGNLDYRTEDDTLMEIFSEFGEVESANQLTDRDDPSRKRGFGFVTFAEKDAAATAVDNLDGLEVDGRSIRVRIAESRN